MARIKNRDDVLSVRRDIARRLVAVRGRRSSREFAEEIGVSPRSLLNWERGTSIPAEVLLRILIMERIEPRWLYCGEGPTHRPMMPDDRPELGFGTLSVLAYLNLAPEFVTSG